MGVIGVALGDTGFSHQVVWSVVFKTGQKRVGRIKALGDGMYAIEDLQPWYFHTSEVSMLAPQILK